MHVYIYDDYLGKSKYNRAINKLEIRLTDLGLNGKIVRLGGIKNIKGTVRHEIKLGAKTIVAVGNNQTVNKIIGAIINADPQEEANKKPLLGIIPIGDDNSIAASFGIKNYEEACNILLARRIEKIDLGLVGDYYFLNQASLESLGTKISIDDYTLEITEKGTVKIINLLSDPRDKIKSNPHDGKLDILIKTRKRDESIITVKKLVIHNPQEKLIVDDVVEVNTPAEIGIMKDKVNVIVGRDRLFE
jgi:diacylglycerol kinase family enzyme